MLNIFWILSMFSRSNEIIKEPKANLALIKDFHHYRLNLGNLISMKLKTQRWKEIIWICSQTKVLVSVRITELGSRELFTVLPALKSFNLQLKELLLGISFHVWSYMIANNFKNGYVILRKSQKNLHLLERDFIL